MGFSFEWISFFPASIFTLSIGPKVELQKILKQEIFHQKPLRHIVFQYIIIYSATFLGFNHACLFRYYTGYKSHPGSRPPYISVCITALSQESTMTNWRSVSASAGRNFPKRQQCILHGRVVERMV